MVLGYAMIKSIRVGVCSLLVDVLCFRGEREIGRHSGKVLKD